MDIEILLTMLGKRHPELKLNYGASNSTDLLNDFHNLQRKFSILKTSKASQINQTEDNLLLDSVYQRFVEQDVERLLKQMVSAHQYEAEDARQIIQDIIELMSQASLKRDIKTQYVKLYSSIDKMLVHAELMADWPVVELGLTLKNDLARFEDSATHDNILFKNEFLAKLNAVHDQFSDCRANSVKPFIGAIYKNLYTTLFGDKIGFFMKPERQADVISQQVDYDRSDYKGP